MSDREVPAVTEANGMVTLTAAGPGGGLCG